MLQAVDQVCPTSQPSIMAIGMRARHWSRSMTKVRRSFCNPMFCQGQLGTTLWRYVLAWTPPPLLGSVISCLPCYCPAYRIEIHGGRCVQRPWFGLQSQNDPMFCDSMFYNPTFCNLIKVGSPLLFQLPKPHFWREFVS